MDVKRIVPPAELPVKYQRLVADLLNVFPEPGSKPRPPQVERAAPSSDPKRERRREISRKSKAKVRYTQARLDAETNARFARCPVARWLCESIGVDYAAYLAAVEAAEGEGRVAGA